MKPETFVNRPSDFVEQTTIAISMSYHQCVEAFLNSLGVNAINVHEFEMHTRLGDFMSSEVFRNGVKVGQVRAGFRCENGYRFLVECVAVKPEKTDEGVSQEGQRPGRSTDRPDNSVG